ncbi:MAG: hypothetical protein ABI663_03425 [Chryseolinea sp.]
MNRLIFLFLMCSLISSCGNRKIGTAGELKAYIANDENGLHKMELKNDLTIEAFYRPTELVWARDLADIHDVQERAKQKQVYDSLSYFMLHFSRKGKELENAYVSDPTKFKAVVDYLSFNISNDLFILHDADTLHALDAVYTRTFGISEGTAVMVVFKENVSRYSGSLKLCFDDAEFGTGLTEFSFNTRDIKNIPTLN